MATSRIIAEVADGATRLLNDLWAICAEEDAGETLMTMPVTDLPRLSEGMRQELPNVTWFLMLVGLSPE